LKAENATDGAYLIQEEVLRTVVAGAEPAKCMREVLPIIRTKSNSVRVVIGQSGAYATDLAEGGIIPLDTSTYSKVDISINKTGTRPAITTELVEDGLFDVVEREIMKAGLRMENKLNRDCIVELLSNLSLTDIDPATADTLLAKEIMKAATSIKVVNRMPDTCLLTAAAHGFLFQDTQLTYASYAGDNKMLRQHDPGILGGLKLKVLNTTTGSTSVYWDDTDGATHYEALVLDSQTPAAYLAIRRDMTVKRYDDPIHDLIGMAVTMRYGVGTIDANCMCGILAK
jgi:hypothetical protein